MKYSIICAFLALPLSAFAADEIIIEAKVIESTEAIPHNLAKLTATKGVDLLAAPQAVTRRLRNFFAKVTTPALDIDLRGCVAQALSKLTVAP